MKRTPPPPRARPIRRSSAGRPGRVRRSTVPIRPNLERQARRRRAYQARLKRPDWQEKRVATFERDAWRCVRVVDDVRCPNGRANGVPLHCNHKTYARFGHELPDDLETLCKPCDSVVTASTRANWM